MLYHIFHNVIPLFLTVYSQRSQYKFIIPLYRLQIKYFSIFYSGPILWNNLENSFKTYLSKSVIKRNLKKRYIILSIIILYVYIYRLIESFNRPIYY